MNCCRNDLNELYRRLFSVVKPICSSGTCPKDRLCISTPSARPLCVTPGRQYSIQSSCSSNDLSSFHLESNLCSSSCHSRGICSNGQCKCSNRTYAGDDCEMCRLSNQIDVGCVHIGVDSPPPCMCYLSRSTTRQTPYLCTTLKSEGGETGEICSSRFSRHWPLRFF